MKHAYMVSFLALTSFLAVVAAPAPAVAGKLYQLDFTVKAPIPALPADIVLNVYNSTTASPSKFEGSSSETFNGNGDIPNHSCDGVACLTDTRIVNGELCLAFSVYGYDGKSRFKGETYFEILINGQPTAIQFHTSCSQPIPLNQQLDGGNGAVYELVGGVGECLPGKPGCPVGNKIFGAHGEFRVDTGACNPGPIVFNLRNKSGSVVGTSTADWTGSGLTNISCDLVTCLTGASIDPTTGDLVVQFESYGAKSDGSFDTESSWEMDLGACGTYTTAAIHTGCTQDAFPLNTPVPAGSGAFLFTDGCGVCVVSPPVSTEDSSWGRIKGQYR